MRSYDYIPIGREYRFQFSFAPNISQYVLSNWHWNSCLRYRKQEFSRGRWKRFIDFRLSHSSWWINRVPSRLGSKATGKPVVGSKFTAWDGYIRGKNLELEKEKRIVQEWVTTDWPKNFPPSRLELNFKDLGGITEITMVHSDVPAVQEDELKQGWKDFYWEPLKDYFRK
jgi:uncharacterized protein YndB with AHSA1/START domain